MEFLALLLLPLLGFSILSDGASGVTTVEGTDENDELSGTDGQDRILGGAGDDQIHGGGDGDFLHGNEGDDTLHGDDGHDTLHGEEGDDTLDGGDGGDFLDGGEGDDILVGGDGDDELIGGTGKNDLQGGEGNDLIVSEGRVDIVHGGEGDDYIVRDRAGQFDHTELHGGAGNDIIIMRDADANGDWERDRTSAYGGEGDDLIYGGLEAHGGEGNDVFVVPVISGDNTDFGLEDPPISLPENSMRIDEFNPDEDVLYIQLPEGAELPGPEAITVTTVDISQGSHHSIYYLRVLVEYEGKTYQVAHHYVKTVDDTAGVTDTNPTALTEEELANADIRFTTDSVDEIADKTVLAG